MPRRERRRVWTSIEDCLELAFRGLKVYIRNSDEKLIQAATVDKIDILKATSISKTKKKREVCRIGRTKFYMGSI